MHYTLVQVSLYENSPNLTQELTDLAFTTQKISKVSKYTFK